MKVEKANPYGTLTKERLSVFECALGLRLPEQYREYLLSFNGGRWQNRVVRLSGEQGETTVHHVYGLHDGPDFCRLDTVWQLFQDRIPSVLLSIADDPGGNKICVGLRGDDVRGRVFFWEHDRRPGPGTQLPAIQIANSFHEFVDALKKRGSELEPDEIKELIARDDVRSIAKLIEGKQLEMEEEDTFGRTLIERAAISASQDVLQYLMGRGARIRKALELAKENAEFFDEHRPIVALLEQYQQKNGSEPV